jgi:predicted anti-sigma-YlaC factor YlaD
VRGQQFLVIAVLSCCFLHQSFTWKRSLVFTGTLMSIIASSSQSSFRSRSSRENAINPRSPNDTAEHRNRYCKWSHHRDSSAISISKRAPLFKRPDCEGMLERSMQFLQP